ncbi:MAG: hypothetical protein ACWA5W_07345 [Phycisphaerales bacterium]
MQSNIVIAALLLYLPIGVGIIALFRGIRGVMLAMILGWVFLPPARGVNLPGLPMYTKEFAVSYAMLIGVLISDSSRVLSYRPKLIDLPILVYITSPFTASITNGLGAYDGLSGIFSNIFLFGVPYFLGRIYIRTPDDVKQVAIWMVIAGLILMPMALWESRMSPNLNYHLYGYHAAQFLMSYRLGGYRPTVFMRHGLEVGLWFATSGAVAFWLWLNAAKSIRIFNFPIRVSALLVLGTSVLSRSLGSIILLFGTMTASIVARTTGLRIVLIAVVLIPPVYLGSRITQIWSPEILTSIIEKIDPERAESLESRFKQETNFSQHALKKPLFGWGGYNRFRPDVETKKEKAVDGLTTIVLGETGLVGLLSYLGMTTLPGLITLLRIKNKEFRSPIWAPPIAITLGISIFSIDMMLNSFFTPLHIFALGVLASSAMLLPKWKQVLKAHQLQQMSSQSKEHTT